MILGAGGAGAVDGAGAWGGGVGLIAIIIDAAHLIFVTIVAGGGARASGGRAEGRRAALAAGTLCLSLCVHDAGLSLSLPLSLPLSLAFAVALSAVGVGVGVSFVWASWDGAHRALPASPGGGVGIGGRMHVVCIIVVFAVVTIEPIAVAAACEVAGL